MVGRPREFDIDIALDAAMQQFWRKGYEATSMADLMAATGLHKGSIYGTLGDKHSLFIQALKRYLWEMDRTKTKTLKDAETPLDGLRNVGHAMIDLVDGDSDVPKGCMAINAIVEMAPDDEEVKKIMDTHVQGMRSSIVEAVTAAQKVGQITKDRPADLIAAMMMTFMSGLSTTMKGYISTEEAHQLFDAQMEAIC
jgi:TetR/AcrR family transcriptional repressor of nem operon